MTEVTTLEAGRGADPHGGETQATDDRPITQTDDVAGVDRIK